MGDEGLGGLVGLLIRQHLDAADAGEARSIAIEVVIGIVGDSAAAITARVVGNDGAGGLRIVAVFQNAAAFLQAMPPGQSRNHLYGSVASQWAQVDVEAAANWVKSLPPGQSSREQGLGRHRDAAAARAASLGLTAG